MPKGIPPPPSVREDSVADRAAERDAARELEEVERALAVLQGKDPEELKRLREARTRAEANFRELADRIAASKAKGEARRRRARARLAIRAGIGVLLGAILVAGGWVGLKRRARWVALDKALDGIAAPYVARGFHAQKTSLATASRAELQTDAPVCLIALGVAESGVAHLRVEHEADVTQGDGTIAWCTCGPQGVTVSATSDEGKPVGIRVLGAPANEVGGSLALPYLDPPPNAFGAETVDCSSEQLDAWVAGRRYPKPNEPEKWFQETPARAALQRAGVTLVGRAATALPFAVAEGIPDGCYVATSTVASDELSLRIDDAKPLDRVRGAIAWCDPKGGSSTVWRSGTGEVAVIAAPSRRVGGMLGMRELARRGELGEVTAWLRAEDLGKDALDTMAASGVTDAALFAPSQQGTRPPSPRVVALSVLEGGSIATDPRTTVAWSCSPSLTSGTSEAVCVQAGSQVWRQVGSERLGAGAEGALPFWMSFLASADDPRGMAQQLALLRLARRLASEGYEPTVLAGVTELAKGAEVAGRTGEDAIIAVGMTARPPSVYPMTDGETWTLDGEPHAIELHAGQRVTVAPTVAVAAGPSERRTLVFRRHEGR